MPPASTASPAETPRHHPYAQGQQQPMPASASAEHAAKTEESAVKSSWKYVKPAQAAAKLAAEKKQRALDVPTDGRAGSMVMAQFVSSDDGSVAGPPLHLPASSTPEQLTMLINELLGNEDPLPYAFSVDDTVLASNLHADIIVGLEKSTEHILSITYQPQAVFRVRSVTRCSSSLAGHTEAVLAVSFSPDGTSLATGSGDTTIRIWDLNTETPHHTLKGHTNWVQIVAWSPDCQVLASGSMDKTIRLWNPKTGQPIGDALRSHSQVITSIVWEPIHKNPTCSRFASSSKDATIKIWDAPNRRVQMTLSQHTAPVTCLAWGGEGLLYSASRDKTIRVWDADRGILVRVLEGHGHWVNHLSLSTGFILKSPWFDEAGIKYKTIEEVRAAAGERYEKVKMASGANERLASCSDDFTLFLWEPATGKKPICRMTGHMQLVNHIAFSPDGRTLASASFDKSVKLWDGITGKFIDTLRGHVGAVYQVAFSSDSRQVLSGSRDSTLKCWDLKKRKLKVDLPGHADEVFSVDWSAAGDKVASGGKDRIVKIWRH